MSLTVVVPTSNRPAYLETCLRSISRQTAVGRITMVIVSENGGARATEEICHKFDSLPIEFRLTETRLSLVAHFHRLLMSADSEFIALLCDDDWWHPWHVETALGQLDGQPGRVSFCSQGVLYNEKLEITERQVPRTALSLFEPGADPAGTIAFSKEAIFSLSWLYTPFHISTLVTRNEAMRSLSEVIATAHPYYIDRILYPHLAVLGQLIYCVPETAGIREHVNNDAKHYAAKEVREAMYGGSEIIRRLGLAQGIDVLAIWKDRYAKADAADRRFFWRWAGHFLDPAELAAMGFPSPDKPDSFLVQFARHWYHACRSFPKPPFYHRARAFLTRRAR